MLERFPLPADLELDCLISKPALSLLSYLYKIHRFPVLSTRCSVMCKVYTGYHDTSEMENDLCACVVDNPLAKARGLSLRTGAQTVLYLSLGTPYIQGQSCIKQLS